MGDGLLGTQPSSGLLLPDVSRIGPPRVTAGIPMILIPSPLVGLGAELRSLRHRCGSPGSEWRRRSAAFAGRPVQLVRPPNAREGTIEGWPARVGWAHID